MTVVMLVEAFDLTDDEATGGDASWSERLRLKECREGRIGMPDLRSNGKRWSTV